MGSESFRNGLRKTRAAKAFLVVTMATWGLSGFARRTPGAPKSPSVHPAAPVPPFHAHPPRGPLPQVLPWHEFVGNPWAENAYRLAARIRPVLYQQPCYCWCSRSLGHTCLLDCFIRQDKHAADCQTCLKEAIFAYQQTKRDVNARTIRAEIIRGDWTKVNLAASNRPPGR